MGEHGVTQSDCVPENIKMDLDADLQDIVDCIHDPDHHGEVKTQHPSHWMSLQAALVDNEVQGLSSMGHDHYVWQGPTKAIPIWRSVDLIRRRMMYGRARPSHLALHTPIHMMEAEGDADLPVANIPARTKTDLWQEIPVLFDSGGSVSLIGQKAQSVIKRSEITQLTTPLTAKSVFCKEQRLHYHTMVTIRLGLDGKQTEISFRAYVAPEYSGGILLGMNAMRQHSISLINDEKKTTVQFGRHGWTLHLERLAKPRWVPRQVNEAQDHGEVQIAVVQPLAVAAAAAVGGPDQDHPIQGGGKRPKVDMASGKVAGRGHGRSGPTPPTASR